MKHRFAYHIPILIVILSLFPVNNAFTQNFAQEDALADLKFLNEAVIKGHGANYYPAAGIDINKTIQRLENIESDSISVAEFRYYLGLALGEIGCLHTSISDYPLNKRMPEPRFFPIPVLLVDGALYIDNHKSKHTAKFIGQKIERINDFSGDKMVERLTNFLVGDGHGMNDVYAEEIGTLYAPKLISYYLGHPEEFSIKTNQGSFIVASETKGKYRYRSIVQMSKQKPILKGERAVYLRRDSVAVLQIGKFKKEDNKFWPRVFDQIASERPNHLVVDLRGNTGGNRETGAALMRYFANEKFEYSILQPQLKAKPYLNNQGKSERITIRIGI